MWLKRLSRVQAFIKLADCTERPRVPEIAAVLGVSERTIRDDFKQLFGIGPVRFLKQRRMQAARQALLACELRNPLISHIAPKTSAKRGCSCSMREKRCISGPSQSSDMFGIRS